MALFYLDHPQTPTNEDAIIASVEEESYHMKIGTIPNKTVHNVLMMITCIHWWSIHAYRKSSSIKIR
jgi:hypothetical protein